MAESNGCGAGKRRFGQDSAGDFVLYSFGRYGKQSVSGGRRTGEQVELRASSALPVVVGLSPDRCFTGGKGDIVVFNSPMPREEHTAVECRPLYISRCIGSAGDTLMLNKDLIQVEGPVFSPDAKELYVYPADQEERLLAMLDTLGIQGNLLAGYTEDGSYIRSFSYYESYLISQKVGKSLPLVPLNERHPEKAYPFVVPAKGQVVKVYPWNVTLLCNTIRLHEHRQATIKGDTLYVEGSPVGHYCFSKDYYWVASNDPVNLCDSRLFGFVPEDHLIGKAWRVWFPIRWERFWQRVQ